MVAFSKIGAVCAGVPVTLGADCRGKVILVKYTTTGEQKQKSVRSNVGLSFITLLSESNKQQAEKSNTQKENNASSSVEEGDQNLESTTTDSDRWELDTDVSSTAPIVRPLPSGHVVNRDDDSGLTYQEIELVMSKCSCSKDLAVNALLSYDGDVDAAVKYVQSMNPDDLDGNDANANVDTIFEQMHMFGQQSDIDTLSFREASSQIGGNVDPDGRNLGETVVVTASQGFPRNEEMDRLLDRDFNDGENVTLGIRFEKDDSIVLKYVGDDSWASEHTNLNDYEYKRYRFTKINSHKVSNREEFFKVMNSLSPGDPVSFTLVKQLYTQGEGVNELCSACRSGDLAILKRVLERNKEINVNTGLEGSNEDLTKRYGKEIDEGSTPLHVACYHGSLLVVQELVNRPDIQVNKENIYYKQTPLHLACMNCQSGAVRILLAHPDVDVNKSDSANITPLNRACIEGDVDIVQQLIERPEINVNAADMGGQTPLMWAAVNGFPMVVKCLLTHPEIDTTKKDWDNKIAFMMASEKRVKEEYDDDDFDADRINKARKEIIDILTEYENKKKSNQM